MRKLLVGFILLFSLLIAACEQQNDLPDLEGKTREEIEEIFDDKGWDVVFTVRGSVELERSYQFIEYGATTNPEQQFAAVIVSAGLPEDENYFVPVDMPYDGPYLDPGFFDQEIHPYFIEVEDRYIGGGGAFEVGYQAGRWHDSGNWINNRAGGCIDGDTTVFEYPSEIFERIESGTPSVRYLNLDTEETWPGGEEEWGQPATQYVCGILAMAESIVIQTDPGDNLLGNHGRLLGWVWVLMPEADDYTLLNYKVIRQGLGVVAYEFGAGETDVTVYDGKRYNEWMHQAETFAREEERGMFSDDLIDFYWDYENDMPHPERWPS